MAMWLIDTNVMLAASAYDSDVPLLARAMPKDGTLRGIIFAWLRDFEEKPEIMVLDECLLIQDEYTRNMPHSMYPQAYAMQVLQHKHDHGLVAYVPIDVIEGNGESIAHLDIDIEPLVPDRADRKWVACALAAHVLHEEMPPIVYGAETDWHIAAPKLAVRGLLFKALLDAQWYEDRITGVIRDE